MQEAQQCKQWSKQHGHDIYSEDEEIKDEEEKLSKGKPKTRERIPENRVTSVAQQHTCTWSTHRDCPYKIRSVSKDIITEQSTVVGTVDITTDQSTSMGSEDSDELLSDDEPDPDVFEHNDITSGNTYGALDTAHKVTDEVWVETPRTSCTNLTTASSHISNWIAQ